MRVGAGIAGILLGIVSLLYVGLLGSVIGGVASWMGAAPVGNSTLSNWGGMVSLVSWLAPGLAILGGIVTFYSPRAGSVFLATSAALHWDLLGATTAGNVFAIPISAAALFAFIAPPLSSTTAPSSSTSSATPPKSTEPPTTGEKNNAPNTAILAAIVVVLLSGGFYFFTELKSDLSKAEEANAESSHKISTLQNELKTAKASNVEFADKISKLENELKKQKAAYSKTRGAIKKPQKTREMAKASKSISTNPSGAIKNDKRAERQPKTEMVYIPAGRFQMGCSPRFNLCVAGSDKVHAVSVRDFEIAKYDVTVSQFAKFVDATNYKQRAGKCDWQHPGFVQNGNRPVVCVDLNDVHAYLDWLNRTTGKRFQLPSTVEWEYAARAGTVTGYYWGRSFNHDMANLGAAKCCKGAISGRDRWVHTSPVDSFPPNAYGLYDMLGNVAQWTRTCSGGLCEIRGGSWIAGKYGAFVYGKSFASPSERNAYTGFRVVVSR